MDDYEDMDIEPQPLGSSNRGGGAKISRAEKSRIAAKSRRDKENVAMQDLTAELPVSDEVLNKMDKTSIIRLAICYIKIKHYVQKDMLAVTTNGNYNGHFGNKVKPALPGTAGNKTKEPAFDVPPQCIEEGQLMLEALNGFLIFISKKGKVQFVSTTVEDHLGWRQVHMIGKPITDFVHNADHGELAKQFSKAPNTGNLAITEHEGYVSYTDEERKVFYLRMRYRLPKPGSKAKNDGYMLVQWSGKIKRHRSSKTGKITSDGLLCICRPMQTTSIMEIRMDGNMFMSRHDLKMTFTFCDTRIITLIGYEPNEVIGKTAYYFHNPLDAPRVSDCHSKLIVKGTSVSKYYRFLDKNGGWVWLQTRATIIYNTSSKPQYIVCMNYVISEEEGERFLMLEEQKQNSLTLPDNQEDYTVSYCTNQNTSQNAASSGPKIVEIPSDDDDDDDDSQLGKSPLPQQMTVTHTPDHKGQKRICIRIPPQPPESQAGSQPVIQPGKFVVSQPQMSQSSMNMMSQTTVNQHGMGQPVLNQTSLSQVAPVGSETGYAMAGQAQQFQPDVKMSNEQASAGFLQDLNQGIVPAVSMAAPAYHSLQPESNYSDAAANDVPSPSGSSNTSSPPYTRKLFPHCASDENMQHLAYDASQGNVSDGGYESATSPYSSTNTASPLQNLDLLQDAESTQSLIQGDNTFLGVGYSCSPPVSVGNSDLAQAHAAPLRDNMNADGIGMDMLDLDELLKSFNPEHLCGNIEFPLSTVSTIANSNTGPLMSSPEPMSVYSPSPERPDSRSSTNDRPFLRQLLNMPENDIPKTPIMVKEFSFHANSPGDSIKSCFSPHSDISDSDSQHSGYATVNRNINNMKSNVMKDENLEGYSKMDLSDAQQDIPDDLPLNILENMTGGEELSDLGNEILMDSDFSKIVSSILTQTDTPQTQYSTAPSKSGTVSGSNNNKTQSKSQFPKVVTQSAHGKQTGNQFCVPVAPKKLGAQSIPKQGHIGTSNNSTVNSLHVDHGYHQTKGNKHQFLKLRSPTGGPSSRVNGQMNGNISRPPYLAQRNCRLQTKDTMTQLEKQLRGWGRDASTPDYGSNRNGQPRPFLEQLLTGELTKDRYIEMERERCRYMKSVYQS